MEKQWKLEIGEATEGRSIDKDVGLRNRENCGIVGRGGPGRGRKRENEKAESARVREREEWMYGDVVEVNLYRSEGIMIQSNYFISTKELHAIITNGKREKSREEHRVLIQIWNIIDAERSIDINRSKEALINLKSRKPAMESFLPPQFSCQSHRDRVREAPGYRARDARPVVSSVLLLLYIVLGRKKPDYR
ncbi:hypothetical protein KM043_018213 [Ampulex compressa]|nr:hypothetical protein KM043_018213 [Ampulex compressa]